MVSPDLISKWFGPKHLKVKNVKSDLRLHGEYRIELLKPDGTGFFIGGTYLKIEAPDHLKYSFEYSGLDNSPPDSTVDIALEELKPKRTKLSLVQKFEILPSDLKNRTKNWEAMFLVLAGHIQSGSGE